MKYRIPAIIMSSLAMTIAGAWIPAVWFEILWLEPHQQVGGLTFQEENYPAPRAWIAFSATGCS